MNTFTSASLTHWIRHGSISSEALRTVLRWEHFGFKPHAFLAETFALVGFSIDEAHLNEIDFGL